jgi:DNA-binding NarL/FixJ family response regulator
MTDLRVLIVDDVEQVRQDLRTLLAVAGGIEVVAEASNGLEAIQLVETMGPQAVLMDLQMPVLEGYEAIRQIKASQPSCRVIALSVHDRLEEQHRAREAGADAFVAKGADYQVLLSAIRGTDKSPNSPDPLNGEEL